MAFESVKKNLEARGFSVKTFDTAAQAVDYLNASIDGVSVGIGGSLTVKEMGLHEKLVAHNTVHWHWTDGEEARVKAAHTDVYITSANGLAESGEIINIDGMGNRVAAMCYGPRQVVVIAGMNKVLGTLDDAIARARNIAAPANAQRFGIKTPCGLTGQCGDCTSPDCICSYVVVTRYSMVHERIKVILVGEDLGL